MATLVTSMLPIVAALVKAEDISGMRKNTEWRPVNEKQEHFLNNHFARYRDTAPRMEEIESIASWSAEEINKFLAAHGLTIQLQDFTPNEFGMASVLTLPMKWMMPGEKRQIKEHGKDKLYPGVWMGKDNPVMYASSKNHSHPIAKVVAENGDLFCITIAPKAPKDDFETMSMIQEIRDNIELTGAKCAGLHFPMVDYQGMGDLSWILGMLTEGTHGNPIYISQALLEAIARVNHLGALFEVGVAMGARSFSFEPDPKKPMIVDQPFFVWIERNGMADPLVYGYIDTDHWKEPASIEPPRGQTTRGGR